MISRLWRRAYRVSELTYIKFGTLMEANQNVWETLVSYQSVIQDLGKGTYV